jgi:hypothetical protein
MMGKWISTTCAVFAMMAAGVWQLTAAFNINGEGYLSKVGPVPLRFQLERPSGTVVLPPLPDESEPPESPAEPPPDDRLSFLPGIMKDELPNRFFLPSSLAMNQLSGTLLAESPAPAGTSTETKSTETGSPASDLLGVPSEMFVDYFKPVPGYTNSPNAVVTVPLQFSPAIPSTTAAAAGASRATYRSP